LSVEEKAKQEDEEKAKYINEKIGEVAGGAVGGMVGTFVGGKSGGAAGGGIGAITGIVTKEVTTPIAKKLELGEKVVKILNAPNPKGSEDTPPSPTDSQFLNLSIYDSLFEGIMDTTSIIIRLLNYLLNSEYIREFIPSTEEIQQRIEYTLPDFVLKFFRSVCSNYHLLVSAMGAYKLGYKVYSVAGPHINDSQFFLTLEWINLLAVIANIIVISVFLLLVFQILTLLAISLKNKTLNKPFVLEFGAYFKNINYRNSIYISIIILILLLVLTLIYGLLDYFISLAENLLSQAQEGQAYAQLDEIIPIMQRHYEEWFIILLVYYMINNILFMTNLRLRTDLLNELKRRWENRMTVPKRIALFFLKSIDLKIKKTIIAYLFFLLYGVILVSFRLFYIFHTDFILWLTYILNHSSNLYIY